MLLARTLAGDYPGLEPGRGCSDHPQTIRGVVGGVDRKLGIVGGGCHAVVLLAFLGSMVVISWSILIARAITLWMLALLRATVIHLLTVRSRLKNRHGQRRSSTDA